LTHASYGNVAMHIRCGGILNYQFITHLLPSLLAKELWKLVNTWQLWAWAECLVHTCTCISYFWWMGQHFSNTHIINIKLNSLNPIS